VDALDGHWRAIFCDLDGCLISGDRILPGARQLVAAAGPRLWIVSNNSTDTEVTLAERLAEAGLDVPAERIVLAGTAAVDWVAAERPAARVALHVGAPVRARARALGLRADAETPEVIVLGRDTAFDYAALMRIAAQLAAGAELVVTNSDGAHPGPDARPVPETGALLAAVLAVTPGQAYRLIGKPGPVLFERALARANVAAGDALMIGDNPATDGEGARRAGIAFAPVPANAGVVSLLGRGRC
jgi:HAD superfamily hydrolase (TIGR01450 family)